MGGGEPRVWWALAVLNMVAYCSSFALAWCVTEGFARLCVFVYVYVYVYVRACLYL